MSTQLDNIKAQLASRSSTGGSKRSLGKWQSTPFLSKNKAGVIDRDANGLPVVIPYLRIAGIRQGFSVQAIVDLYEAMDTALDAVAMAMEHASDPATAAELLGPASAPTAASAPAPAAQPNSTLDRLKALAGGK